MDEAKNPHIEALTSIEKKELYYKIKGQLKSVKDREEAMKLIVKRLHEEISYYDWVGFYLVNPENPRELILGPFVGEPTEHVKIGFGVGICGQAAELKDVFIVQDVSKETNYLSCSPDVKSEIVVPVMKGDEVLGEIDIDSHLLSPFTSDDRVLLEEIANLLLRFY